MPRAWYTQDIVLHRAKRLAVFVGVVVVYIVLRRVPVLHTADAWARHQLVRFGTAVGGAIERVVASEDSLSARLNACEESRMALGTEHAELLVLADEAAELEYLLGFASALKADRIAARVVSRSVGGTSSVTLDRGANDGVTTGMAAVIGDGILYGTVTDVGNTSSTIRLTTDRQSAVPAAIMGEPRTIGLVRGQEGALLSMEFIPQDAKVDGGDVVVTSGLDGAMPEGLVLGTVSAVVVQESAPFKTAVVEPLHDPREWSTMFLLAPLNSL